MSLWRKLLMPLISQKYHQWDFFYLKWKTYIYIYFFFEILKYKKKLPAVPLLILKQLSCSVFYNSGKHDIIEHYSLVFNSSLFKTLEIWSISWQSFSFLITFASTVPEEAFSPGRRYFLKIIRIKIAGIKLNPLSAIGSPR